MRITGAAPPATGPDLRSGVPLAPFTTLELGGPAELFVEVDGPASLRRRLAWARDRGIPVTLLGGGSNVVVADAGIAGLVVRIALRGLAAEATAGGERVTAAAGEPWDDLVTWSTTRGLSGIECLSGIPGTVGATPIQNVGAYGQEVADTIASVRVLDRTTLAQGDLSAVDCGFAYRSSLFRRRPGRHVVLSVTFALQRTTARTIQHEELSRLLASRRGAPTPAEVRAAVLELRRAKSMLADPSDDNGRSAGSFFVNPVLGQSAFAALCRRAVAAEVVTAPDLVPRFPTADGAVKVPAAWLVEHAGFARGTRRGPVGISTRHSLALVHHGGGATADLVALAGDVRRAVAERFGVVLRPEPVFLGFPPGDPLGPPPIPG